MSGLYEGGDGRSASFDVTDLDAAWVLRDDDEPPYGLAFALARDVDVELRVIWGPEQD